MLKGIIIRHRRENLKKCSLRGLETRDDLCFYQYPHRLPILNQPCLILDMNAPVISEKDQDYPVIILDGTWKLAKKMFSVIHPFPGSIYRSLPNHFITAYPRTQTDCDDPERGLASVEALYLSFMLLGYSTEGLLNHYYWKEEFLQKNHLEGL